MTQALTLAIQVMHEQQWGIKSKPSDLREAIAACRAARESAGSVVAHDKPAHPDWFKPVGDMK